MSYRMTKVDGSSYKITYDRELIGWCRRWAGGTWECKTEHGQGRARVTGRGFGMTPQEAFNGMCQSVKWAPMRKPRVLHVAEKQTKLRDYGTVPFKVWSEVK